ncbi:MAG TPA: FGGY family carbohydrate kinase [Paracoccus sp. (in: a-proteobacteria)]|uniref:FGGY family carbohydrate kinase n=1 Tax=uncultured Paracoccus sp. TaxID=189685 RepID=UPI00262CF5C9|nr:FGGY family carbohydrate kinase [uncultured Paracoccus sp.]HMQ41943.1 FGGY family carbohydrate kinase [Paracoccus sp. (in: a-proteobacteria)]HMR36755.1 FGGY family carbohydrate kinase [Paracoccus sp. (in: a-proteobacteria)]
MTRILAIDQGTTNTKAVLFDDRLAVIDRASAPLVSTYPADGWAEQSAGAIRDSVAAVIAMIAEQNGAEGIEAIAIANQRETLVVWDAETGKPIAPAILWQCRRTADACAALEAAGHGPEVLAATGLGINPLFLASKLGWVMQNLPEARELAATGRLRAGTVDAWLIWSLTGGAVFATDHSNASRTQLFDTAALRFSEALCTIFGAPLDALPEPRASDAGFGVTAGGATALPAGIPIRAVMGDSHAALYGHGVTGPGEVKATFGTGSSLMALTPERIASSHGLSGTIGWTAAGQPHYAVEGNITVSAQAAEFVARMLGVANAAALSDLAQTVPDSAGVSFVPALAGLGAPHWDDAARGTVAGLTLGSQPAHLARATFEAIAHQVTDVFEAMEQDCGRSLDMLRADGGASANDWLMQLQADLLGHPVIRSEIAEIGARGAAAMALAALGREVPPPAGGAAVFAPQLQESNRLRARENWRHAVDMARHRAD